MRRVKVGASISSPLFQRGIPSDPGCAASGVAGDPAAPVEPASRSVSGVMRSVLAAWLAGAGSGAESSQSRPLAFARRSRTGGTDPRRAGSPVPLPYPPLPRPSKLPRDGGRIKHPPPRSPRILRNPHTSKPPTSRSLIPPPSPPGGGTPKGRMGGPGVAIGLPHGVPAGGGHQGEDVIGGRPRSGWLAWTRHRPVRARPRPHDACQQFRWKVLRKHVVPDGRGTGLRDYPSTCQRRNFGTRLEGNRGRRPELLRPSPAILGHLMIVLESHRIFGPSIPMD